jgi:hypothetical protein
MGMSVDKTLISPRQCTRSDAAVRGLGAHHTDRGVMTGHVLPLHCICEIRDSNEDRCNDVALAVATMPLC